MFSSRPATPRRQRQHDGFESSLFASSSPKAVPPPSEYHKGYLLFPPGRPPSATFFSASSSSSPPRPIVPLPGFKESSADPERRKQTAEDELLAKLKREREEQEAAAIKQSEEEWVRCGLTLYDSDGKRDVARTESIRAELALRDKEKRLMEQWDAYEKGWREILRKTRLANAGTGVREGGGGLKFEDIPWPVVLPPSAPSSQMTDGLMLMKLMSYQERRPEPRRMTPEDLTEERIRSFLLDNLEVRGCTVSKKDRVRQSYLRWHPDKMGGLLEHVGEEDRDAVKQGVGAVMMCLHKMNEEMAR